MLQAQQEISGVRFELKLWSTGGVKESWRKPGGNSVSVVAAKIKQRPHPTALIPLSSLKTRMLIHGSEPAVLMTHQIFFIMSVIALMLGLKTIHA